MSIHDAQTADPVYISCVLDCDEYDHLSALVALTVHQLCKLPKEKAQTIGKQAGLEPSPSSKVLLLSMVPHHQEQSHNIYRIMYSDIR
jgi:hypothetical protein